MRDTNNQYLKQYFFYFMLFALGLYISLKPELGFAGETIEQSITKADGYVNKWKTLSITAATVFAAGMSIAKSSIIGVIASIACGVGTGIYLGWVSGGMTI